jgi:hypothetical protein
VSFVKPTTFCDLALYNPTGDPSQTARYKILPTMTDWGDQVCSTALDTNTKAFSTVDCTVEQGPVRESCMPGSVGAPGSNDPGLPDRRCDAQREEDLLRGIFDGRRGNAEPSQHAPESVVVLIDEDAHSIGFHERDRR